MIRLGLVDVLMHRVQRHGVEFRVRVETGGAVRNVSWAAEYHAVVEVQSIGH
jgi:hypothetical protein